MVSNATVVTNAMVVVSSQTVTISRNTVVNSLPRRAPHNFFQVHTTSTNRGGHHRCKLLTDVSCKAIAHELNRTSSVKQASFFQ